MKMKAFAKKIYALSYRFSIFYPFLGTRGRKFVDENNLWLHGKKKLQCATTLQQTIKSKVSTKFLKKFSENILKEVYSSKEYQKKKKDFLDKNSEFAEGFKNWDEYNFITKNEQNDS